MQTTLGMMLVALCLASGLCQLMGPGVGDTGVYPGANGGGTMDPYPARAYPAFNRNAMQSQKGAWPLLYYYLFDNYVF
ncbi:hypothetical protein ACOMHN_030496 [Nucella lapillus]